MKAALFDLDGVLVDTAQYHYLAWRELAHKLGFEFTPEHNERLKGVSRMRSLEILLEVGGMTMTPEEMAQAAREKNDRYVASLQTLDAHALLPGARAVLEGCRARGIRTALGSASKNAPMILEKLGITALLDAIVDGNSVSRAKPDPQVFMLGAQRLNVAPEDCVVFEDALAGVQAAHAAGMRAFAIGTAEKLPGAEWYGRSLADVDLDALLGQ
jgi:beta-phosphoglucomutase